MLIRYGRVTVLSVVTIRLSQRYYQKAIFLRSQLLLFVSFVYECRRGWNNHCTQETKPIKWMLTIFHFSFSVSSAASAECTLEGERKADCGGGEGGWRDSRGVVDRTDMMVDGKDGWGKVTVALGAVTFNSTVRGAVIPEQHMPPCDSSSSIPACYLACLLLSCVWVCLNEQSDTHSAAFTRPVKHDISFTPPLTSSSLHPLALYGTDKQGHILGV